MLELPLPNFFDSILEERLVGMVIHVKLEERLAPVMRPIGLLEVIVGQYANVFCAVQNAILMPIVDDLMPTGCHHLPELNYFLGVSAGVKLFAGNRVR